MVKPLLILLVSLGVGMALLQLRQQRLELTHQTNQIHDEIANTQSQLWEQQLRIAAQTAPNAIEALVHRFDLQLDPVRTLPLEEESDEQE